MCPSQKVTSSWFCLSTPLSLVLLTHGGHAKKSKTVTYEYETICHWILKWLQLYTIRLNHRFLPTQSVPPLIRYCTLIRSVGSLFPGGESYTDTFQVKVLVQHCTLPGASAPSCHFSVGSKWYCNLKRVFTGREGGSKYCSGNLKVSRTSHSSCEVLLGYVQHKSEVGEWKPPRSLVLTRALFHSHKLLRSIVRWETSDVSWEIGSLEPWNFP